MFDWIKWVSWFLSNHCHILTSKWPKFPSQIIMFEKIKWLSELLWDRCYILTSKKIKHTHTHTNTLNKNENLVKWVECILLNKWNINKYILTLLFFLLWKKLMFKSSYEWKNVICFNHYIPIFLRLFSLLSFSFLVLCLIFVEVVADRFTTKEMTASSFPSRIPILSNQKQTLASFIRHCSNKT